MSTETCAKPKYKLEDVVSFIALKYVPKLEEVVLAALKKCKLLRHQNTNWKI